MHVKGLTQWLAPSKGSIKGCCNTSPTLVAHVRNLSRTSKRENMNYPKDISLLYEIQGITGLPSYRKNQEVSGS